MTARGSRLGALLLFGLLAATPVQAQEEPAPPAAATTEPAPRLLIKGFGNVSYEVGGDDIGNEFVLGELDIFMTSSLAENLSVLAEVVLEPQEGHEAVIDLERYQIKWAPSDLASVAAGRMHTWVGHWNHTYHHGTWFQTTAFRPLIYRFEDDGGLLPLHEVGLQALGTWASDPVALQYNVSLTNGRGPTSVGIQNVYDANDGKAVNVWAAVQPTAVPGLQIGGSLRFDSIPADPDGLRPHGEMDERIRAAFAVFERGSTQILAEYAWLEHREDVSGGRFVSHGFYIQGSTGIGRGLRLYYRYDDVDRDQADPFYTLAEPNQRKQTVGLRLDPWPWAGLMLEASHHDLEPGDSFSSATAQVAFTF